VAASSSSDEDSTSAGGGTCPTCGRSLDDHDQDIRFRLPDPVLGLSAAEREDRTWGNDVLLQVRGIGAFVRCLLPVRLQGGHTLTFGLWLGVEGSALHRAWERWWSPSYAELVLDGFIANDVQPWGLLGRPAHAVVHDRDAVPYLDSSEDELVTRVLAEEWDHDAVI
jgi:hypothetical protein